MNTHSLGVSKKENIALAAIIIINKWIWGGQSYWPKIPLWITNNQCTTVIKYHQDFKANMHSNFFHGQTDRGLIYWPNQESLTEGEGLVRLTSLY
jgi:hypothetical protein